MEKTFERVQTLEEHVSKSERVYDILRESIVKRRFVAGEKLVERDLARKLKVSKTPVREALSRLEREGLIEGSSYRSFSVTQLSERDIVEIYDIREIANGLAARCAANKADKKQIEQLYSIIQSFRDHVKRNDLRSYNSLDIEFHNLLGAISENKRLREIMQLLRNQTRVLMTTSVTLLGRAEASLSEHTKIVDAIASQEADLAERLTREHIRNVKRAVLGTFKKPSEVQPIIGRSKESQALL